MKIGSVLVDVSPKTEVSLAGFGNPARKYLGVHDPIMLSCTVIEQDGVKVAIMTGDVLGFDHSLLVSVREEIEAKTGIPKNNILFNASHTHSGPTTYVFANPRSGAYIEEYGKYFYEQVVETVVKADADLEDGELYFGTGICYGIGGNRRNISTGVYHFAPYEAGPRNDEVTVLKAVCGGKLKALLYNFNCHPSTIGFDTASADYPGVARRILREKFDCVCGMLQGCCGNIRARTVNDSGQGYRGGTYEDIERFGAMLASTVSKVLDRPMKKVEGPIAAQMTYFSLPLSEKAPKEYYESMIDEKKSGWFGSYSYQYYTAHYDELLTERDYSVQCIDFGSALSFVALEGEVCVEYDFNIKAMAPDRHIVVCGYSNGLPGYICPEDMYPYGGYEPKDSTLGYLIHEGFRPENEKLILVKCRELICK